MTDKPTGDYGPVQAPGRLGIAVWQFEAALRRGLIPPADRDGRRWSAELIEEALQLVPDIVTAVGEQPPIGANRAAEFIAERVDLEVERSDVEALADRGVLAEVGEYKGWALYDVRDLADLVDRESELIAAIVAERRAWLEASVPARGARERLGWSRGELEEVAQARGVAVGRFGRYARADIDALAGDEDLDDEVVGNRLLGPDQAAEHLEIRRRDFDYCVAVGWITPTRYTESSVSRRRVVDVPLYRRADVDALRELPDVDWEAVRDTKPGEASPLREFAMLPTDRASLVRGFAADLAEWYGIEVTARFADARERWELRWTATTEGQPSAETVRALITSDPDLRPHSDSIALQVDPPG